MNVFLYAPQKFENVCVLARTLEAFGSPCCHVFDPHGLIRERYGKSYSKRLRSVSAGAFFRINWQRVEDPLAFIGSGAGRCVATLADPSAESLYALAFHDDDTLVFGSEVRGLPAEIVERCQRRVTIPQRGQTQSLNLSVASGIVIAEWARQRANAPASAAPLAK